MVAISQVSTAENDFALPTQPGYDIQKQLLLDNHDKLVLAVMAGYIVAIFVLWNIPVLKHILTPFKYVSTALHEFGHASVAKCTGGDIQSIEIDVDTGGVTKMRGGNAFCTLPAGYLASSFYGGLMIFAGFDVLGSQIIAVILGVALLLVLYWAGNWIARITCLLYVVVIAVLWWWNGSLLLPYFVLFMGVVCSCQSLWDFQGLILYRHPESDASKFAELFGCCPAQVWGGIWAVMGLVFMAGFAFLGIIAFKKY